MIVGKDWPATETVSFRVLAINDFHGALDPVTARWGRDVGGIEALAGLIGRLRRGVEHSYLVGAGDLIGGSPFKSSSLDDMPAVAALAAMGLEVSSVGNHEFDRGLAHLLNVNSGHCITEACQLLGQSRSFLQIQYLAANVTDRESGARILPAYKIVNVRGVPVAFIGAVTKRTPWLVSAEGVSTLRFQDEAESINEVVADLTGRGVRAFVALVHEGGAVKERRLMGDCEISGPIAEIARRLSPEVDVVVSGHSHEMFICAVNGIVITQAGHYGAAVTAIDLELDLANRDVMKVRARNHIAKQKDRTSHEMFRRIQALANEAAERLGGKVMAEISVDQLTREPIAGGESQLGRVVADAQLYAARAYDAQIACVNPGSIRQSLPQLAGLHGRITYGDIAGAQPFDQEIVVIELSGKQLLSALNFGLGAAMADGIPSCSRGFRYDYTTAALFGARLVPGSATLNDEAINPSNSYRVAVNGFLAKGGDRVPFLLSARRLGAVGTETDALVGYLQKEGSGFSAPLDVRARRQPN